MPINGKNLENLQHSLQTFHTNEPASGVSIHLHGGMVARKFSSAVG